MSLKRIYLSPDCCEEEERYWAQDPVDQCNCFESCGDIEYVRADLYEHLRKRVAELESALRTIRDEDDCNPYLMADGVL